MQLVPCAQIAKTYGKDGEILLRVESDSFSEMLEEALLENEQSESGIKAFMEPVFIYFDGLPVPFFIETLKHRSGNAWVVTLSTIRDSSHAEEVVGRNLFMDVAGYSGVLDSISADGNISDFSEAGLDILVGFSVLGEDGKTVGIISKVFEYPGNICLELEGSGTLLPFHQDLIIYFDPEGKIISMKIPKGLL